MSSTERILPPDTAVGDDVTAHVTAAFRHVEMAATMPLGTHLRIAGLGTVSHRVLGSDSFAAALAGVSFDVVGPHASPEMLLADPTWDAALVFSPYKSHIAGLVSSLAPTAAATGTVDIVVRFASQLVGFNTTAWAVQVVLESHSGARPPHSTLVLGGGSSARSVVIAARRAWGEHADIAVAARDLNSLGVFSGVRTLNADAAAGERPSVLVNCTTWGETPESEHRPFGLPFEELLRPGMGFLDLNNRVSRLQEMALSAGVYATSGVAVREANNACRGALLTGARELNDGRA